MNQVVAQHRPREGSTADRALKFLEAIGGRPVKTKDLADRIEAPLSSMYAAMTLPAFHGLIVRLDTPQGQCYCLPGRERQPIWGPTDPVDVEEPPAAPAVVAVPARAESPPAPPAPTEQPKAEQRAEPQTMAEHVGRTIAEAPRRRGRPPNPRTSNRVMVPAVVDELRCALWNDGQLEVVRGDERMQFNEAETRQLLKYLQLFEAPPSGLQLEADT